MADRERVESRDAREAMPDDDVICIGVAVA